MVNGRYVTSPTPIPKFDNPKMDMMPALQLFGAGREKRIYAVPPHTSVAPLEFEDVPFRVEYTPGQRCAQCGCGDSFLTSHAVSGADGTTRWVTTCSDTSFCAARQAVS
jgi:alpha-D-ribose 1-methylphosphonate 5-phosphate C-P lyase